MRGIALAILTVAIGSIEAAAQNPGARRALEVVLPEIARLAESEKSVLIGLFQTQTTTFPIGSSAGGFAWSFDRALGIPTRRSRSFGPMFAERPLTNGRHRLSVSLGHQRTQWRAMAGQHFADGLYFASGNGSIEYVSQFRLATEQTVVTTTFGLTDRVDVGARVPYVRQRVAGTLFFRCNYCDDDSWQTDTAVDATSAGFGDVTVQSKVLLPSRGIDLAVGVELRLPTGKEQELLGSGDAQLTTMLIGGGQYGEVSPHFNVGYTFAGPGLLNVGEIRPPTYLRLGGKYQEEEFRPSDEFKYTLGIEFVAGTKVTIAGDISGRALFKAAQPVMLSSPGLSEGLTIQRDTVNLLLGAVSAKVWVSGRWLITTAVAFPLNNSGIQPGVTPVFGVERAF